jgi:hypothetical protein
MAVVVLTAWLYSGILAAGLLHRQGVSLWNSSRPLASLAALACGVAGTGGCIAAESWLAGAAQQAVLGLLLCGACLGVNLSILRQPVRQQAG